MISTFTYVFLWFPNELGHHLAAVSYCPSTPRHGHPAGGTAGRLPRAAGAVPAAGDGGGRFMDVDSPNTEVHLIHIYIYVYVYINKLIIYLFCLI